MSSAREHLRALLEILACLPRDPKTAALSLRFAESSIQVALSEEENPTTKIKGALRHGTVEGFREHAFRRDPPCKRCWTAFHNWIPEMPDPPVEPMPPSPEPVFVPIQHGTVFSYKTRRCRCDLCRKANADAARQTKINRGYTPPESFSHGAQGYTYYGCRCEVCREGTKLARRKWRATQKDKPKPPLPEKPTKVLEFPVPLPPRSIQHGKVHTYKSHGCRCEECTRANTDSLRRTREKLQAEALAGSKEIPHGLTGYNMYKCRCEVCKSAAAERRSRYKDQTQG